jgi:hypothetical protein
MSGASIVAAEQARFNVLKWTYAPSTGPNALQAWDGSITITETTTTHGTITGPAVDCSHFVQQAMLAAGYNVPFETSAQLASIVNGASSSYYTVDSTPQEGDIVVFVGANGQGHVGIVTNYNLSTHVVTFDNAQHSSKGLMQGQTCQAAIGSSWGSNDAVLGYLTVNSSAYNPTAAASALSTINSAIDQGLYNAGLPEYFGTSISSSTVSSISQIVGPNDPSTPDPDAPGEAPWSTTIATSGSGDQKSLTYSYNSADDPSASTYNFTTSRSFTADTGTDSSLAFNSSTNVLTDDLTVNDPVSLGTLSLNVATNVGTLTLTDGMAITLSSIPTTATLTTPSPSDTPEEALLSYLSDLGDTTTASTLNTANESYEHPTGTTYTLTGIITGSTDTFEMEANQAPGAHVTGVSGDTNILVSSQDITQDTISNIQDVWVSDNNTAMTGTQFNGFSEIVNFDGGSPLTLIIASSGSYTLNSSRIGSPFNLTAGDWGGTTLTGNSQADQTLSASLYGTDTLNAGSGAGDVLVAGEGVDTLNGGTGGDTFVTYDIDESDSGLAAGSTVTGNGTGNVLEASGDISGATISGVQTLEAEDVALTASQLSGFTSINTDNGDVEATTAGTYSVASITTEVGFTLDASETAANVTLIGNNTASQTLIGSTGTDTLTTGTGTGDAVDSNGTSDVVNLNGASGTANINGGGGSWTNANAASDVVNDYGTSDTIVSNATSQTINSIGNSETVDYDGTGSAAIISGTNTWAYMDGNSNTLTTNSGSTGDNINASGTGEHITLNAEYDTVTATNSSDVISITGYNNWINLNGAGDSVTLSDTGGGGSSIIVNGNTDTVTTSGNENDDYVALNGTTDTLTVNGSNLWVDVNGTGDAVNGTGTSTQVNIDIGASSTTVSGKDDSFGVENGVSTTMNGGDYTYYEFGTSFGTDVINNAANGGITTANGQINFSSSTTDEDLWFKQSGNNLVIDLLGTTGTITIDNWFGSNAGAKVADFAADGLNLTTQVSALVSAMATYQTAHTSFNPQTSGTTMPTDTTLQNAIASSWHS